jgi:hypothetical protein
MPNNLAIGNNGVVAKADIDFIDAGVTALNTAIIYEVGSPNKSYVPGRLINAVTAFTKDKGYYIVMLAAVDWSAHVVPPVDEPFVATIVYEDTFNAADDADIAGRVPTNITGGASVWEKVVGSVGNLQILSNALVADGDPSKYFINHPVRNVDLRCTIKEVSSPIDGVGFGMWLLYAFTNDDNYMITNLINGETYKKVATVQTQIYAGSGVTTAGQIVRVVLNGTSLQIYRNSTLLHSATISATENAGTGHGILSAGAINTDNAIEQFTSYTVS